MPIGILIEIPGITPEQYDAVNAKANFVDDPPEGLHAHAAGKAENGNWRIFEVWESREASDRFDEARLIPALREVLGEEVASNPPPMEYFELHRFLNP